MRPADLRRPTSVATAHENRHVQLPGSSPATAASGRPLQLINERTGLSYAQVLGTVDAETLLQGLSKVEALAIGDRVQCWHLAGTDLRPLVRGLPLPFDAAWSLA